MSLINNSPKIDYIDSFKFKHPFTCMIAGPTQSGKTTILQKFLSECDNGLVEPKPDCIYYCYSRWQKAYDDIRKNRNFSNSGHKSLIYFQEGLPDIGQFNSFKNNILILDDLMGECGKDKNILNIFTTDSHHMNISVIFLTQNIFSQERYSRTISLNCQYLILTKNPRDKLQLIILAKQMFPASTKFFAEAYEDAVTKKNFGYLLIDLNQITNDENRVQTGIFNNEERIIYRKNKF